MELPECHAFHHTIDLYTNQCVKHLIIVLDSQGKVKDAVAVVVDFLFDEFDDP